MKKVLLASCFSQRGNDSSIPRSRSKEARQESEAEATRLASSQNEQPLAVQHVRPLGEAAADARLHP